jgi:hypothetical protein
MRFVGDTIVDSGLSPWNTRLIDVITDCEDDVRRYSVIIERIRGVHKCNVHVLSFCMENADAHRHLAVLTAMEIVDARLRNAGFCGDAARGKPDSDVRALRAHIRLIHAMMLAILDQLAAALDEHETAWHYSDSLLAKLLNEQMCIAMREAIAVLHQKFSCTLVTAVMAAIEPAMKCVQDRLSLRPELPLNRKAFAGSLLSLKSSYLHGEAFTLEDLAADLSQLFKIPRTICLSG